MALENEVCDLLFQRPCSHCGHGFPTLTALCASPLLSVCFETVPSSEIFGNQVKAVCLMVASKPPFSRLLVFESLPRNLSDYREGRYGFMKSDLPCMLCLLFNNGQLLYLEI